MEKEQKEKVEKEVYRIFITGSRKLGEFKRNVECLLNDIKWQIIRGDIGKDKNVEVYCGDADGVDKIVGTTFGYHVGGAFLNAHPGIPTKVYTQSTDNTPRHGGHVYGTIVSSHCATHTQRDDMLADKCDMLIAICVDGSKGTLRNINGWDETKPAMVFSFSSGEKKDDTSKRENDGTSKSGKWVHPKGAVIMFDGKLKISDGKGGYSDFDENSTT